MIFLNRTASSALCFTGVDLQDEEFRVVVLKAGYRMMPAGQRGHFRAELMEEVALCMKDDYYGQINQSCVREESDLAHFKARCDVIFRGDAYAPFGKAAAEWDVRMKIGAPASSCDMVANIGT